MDKYQEFSIAAIPQAMLKKAHEDGVVTVWDRARKQEPQCLFCKTGLSCRVCAMVGRMIRTESRITAYAELTPILFWQETSPGWLLPVQRHIQTMRATLLAFSIKIGNGKAPGYSIKDPEKMKRVSSEYGIDTGGLNNEEIALRLAEAMMEDFGMKKGRPTFLDRVPKQRLELWEKVGCFPRGIDRETTETMHRTHMGVDNNYVSILLHAVRNSLSDGYGGSMIGTELSDIIFGTPTRVFPR